MLSPNEFTVGTIGSAKSLSLVLPREERELTALIGLVDAAPAAVILSGQFAFRFFKSAGNNHWHGLIVPDVRIEVDETSLFDPDTSSFSTLGSVVRSDTRVVINAISESGFRQLTAVTLQEGLPPAEDASRAAFASWQVVIGNEAEKRVLWRATRSGAEIG